jgi:hypothetical protein
MKNTLFVARLLAFTLVFGMTVVGCSKTLTLTNIPTEYDGAYASLIGHSGNGKEAVNVAGGREITYDQILRMQYPVTRISEGKVKFPLWQVNEKKKIMKRYSGNHTVDFRLWLTAQENKGLINSVQFSAKGNATKSWNDLK